MKIVAMMMAAVISIAGQSAQAKAGEESAMAMGNGVATCAAFGQDVKRDVLADVIYFKWAQGYMSGMNTIFNGMNKSTRDLRAISIQGQQQKIREYCDSHPLKEYLEGAFDLYVSLPTVPHSNN